MSGRAVSSLFIVTVLSAAVLTVNVFAVAFSAAAAQSSVRSQLAVIVGVVRVRTASPAVVIFADATVFGIVSVFSVMSVLMTISSSPVLFILRAEAMFSYPVPLTSTGALSGSTETSILIVTVLPRNVSVTFLTPVLVLSNPFTATALSVIGTVSDFPLL